MKQLIDIRYNAMLRANIEGRGVPPHHRQMGREVRNERT